MFDFKKLLFALLVLLGGAVVVYVWLSMERPAQTTDTTPPASETVTENPAKSQGGFELLVSVTDNGFEPSEPSVRSADTIRFTNNSSEDVWIEGVVSSGNPAYPEEGECGVSAFDSCKNIKPGEFWEFKFKDVGTWLFRNKLDTTQVGVVYVRE